MAWLTLLLVLLTLSIALLVAAHNQKSTGKLRLHKPSFDEQRAVIMHTDYYPWDFTWEPINISEEDRAYYNNWWRKGLLWEVDQAEQTQKARVPRTY